MVINKELNELVHHNQDNTKCLSINDVLSCTHDDSAGAGVKYLFEDKLRDLVKSKLNDLWD
jgi:hypothetical protein